MPAFRVPMFSVNNQQHITSIRCSIFPTLTGFIDIWISSQLTTGNISNTCFASAQQRSSLFQPLISVSSPPINRSLCESHWFLGFGTVCPTSNLNFYGSQSGLGYVAVTNNSQFQCLKAMKVYFLICYMTIACWLGVQRGPVQHFPPLQTQVGPGSISLLLLCVEDSICFISFNPHSYYSCFSEEETESWR